MNRANVVSLLLLCGTLVWLGPTQKHTESVAEPASPVLTQPQVEVVLANTGLKPVATPAKTTSGVCPDGMLEVEGDYCPEIEQPCTKWIDPEGVFPRRCAEFAPTKPCRVKTSHKHFCIDRFEWPNKAGESPIVMKTWYEARDACGAIGKRLCGDSEWTVACEGQERLPYPYGYNRSSEACNNDKPHQDVNEKALGSSDPKVRDAEVKRLWQGEPSGSRESCVSPYGVADMTGNVDEWVVNESGHPYNSGLKGGYWGPVRDRCRPMTTVHAEGFSFYQIGFRCCADSPGTGSSRSGDSATPGASGTASPGTDGSKRVTGS